MTMISASKFIDLDNLPERFLPELRNIDFRYGSGSHSCCFQPEPVDCDVIVSIWDGIHAYKIHGDSADGFRCVIDNLPAYSPRDGVIWLHRGSLNQWRLLAWWGDPQQLRQHDDVPTHTDYPIELKIAF